MTDDELNAQFAAAEDGDTVAEEAVTMPADEVAPVEEVTPEAEVADDGEETAEEDFFGDEDDGFELPDPTRIITVMTSSGGKAYVPTDEPISVDAVISKCDFRVMAGAEYYLNGSLIPSTELVPPGQTLQIVGTVKGGAL